MVIVQNKAINRGETIEIEKISDMENQVMGHDHINGQNN